MNAPVFETEPCTRCGGSGHYSFCQMHGTTCFKCAGAKVQLTKRGYAARLFFRSLLDKPARECVVGDCYKLVGYKGFFRITEIKPTPGGVEFVSKRSSYTMGLDTVIAIVPTPEARDAAIAKALEYQATLTKMGKPRKV